MSQRDALDRRLSELGRMKAASLETEKRIRAASAARLKTVETDIERLRSRTWTDDYAAKEYQALIEERGHLQRLIAQ